MNQLSLESCYTPGAIGKGTWDVELDALRDAVALLTVKEVCDVLDVNRSALCDALAERDRKRMAAEWPHVIVAMLVRRGDDAALDIVRRIIAARAQHAPFVIVDATDDISPEEEAAARRLLDRVNRRRKKPARAA